MSKNLYKELLSVLILPVVTLVAGEPFLFEALGVERRTGGGFRLAVGRRLTGFGVGGASYAHTIQQGPLSPLGCLQWVIVRDCTRVLLFTHQDRRMANLTPLLGWGLAGRKGCKNSLNSKKV